MPIDASKVPVMELMERLLAVTNKLKKKLAEMEAKPQSIAAIRERADACLRCLEFDDKHGAMAEVRALLEELK